MSSKINCDITVEYNYNLYSSVKSHVRILVENTMLMSQIICHKFENNSKCGLVFVIQ